MPIRLRSAVYGGLGWVVLLAFNGCMPKPIGLPTVNVSGTLTLDGTPLENATISMNSDKHAVRGLSGPDGKYTIRGGALPGNYRVFISKLEGIDLTKPPEMAMDPAQPTPQHPQIIPEFYSDPTKSQLILVVPESGTSAADFDLKSN